MKGKDLFTVIVVVFLSMFILQSLLAVEMPIRVRGGKVEDFEDSKGHIWHGAQQTDQPWGGYIGPEPLTAEVQKLTDDAKEQAKEAGYDEELFYAVSYFVFPSIVEYELNTGNGTFDVNFLLGEHWQPGTRCFDIFIEEENVFPLYVTPAPMDSIDIQKFEGIEVSDGAMTFTLAGNPAGGKPDMNAMFGGLEVNVNAAAVSLAGKLTTTWGEIKHNH